MAESLGKAVLELAADHLGLDKDLDEAKKKAETSAQSMGAKFKSGLKKAMVPAAAVLGLVGLKAKESIDAASDLGEQINKTSTVFGKSAPSIQKWSTTTAKGIGISQRAALEAAGVFGNMLVPMGFARSKAADMSKGLVKLAADMASFNNADPSEVLEALRSGLSGETEPLRKFGVFLNDARLKQEALSLGIYKGKGPLDAQAKAQATYALILKDTKDAQGDFAKTATSAANASRIQAAVSEDVNAKIGKGLLPAYRALQQMLLSVTGFMASHTSAVKIAVGVITALAAAVIAINVGMKLYAAGAAVVTAAQWLWNASLMGFPLIWVVAAIAAVIAIIVLAIKHWDDIKRVTGEVWAAIKGAVIAGANAVVNAMSSAWGKVKAATSAAWNWIKSHLKTILAAILIVITGPIGAIVVLIASHWGQIKSATSSAWGTVKSTVSGAVSAVVSFVKSIPGKIASALASLGSTLKNIATSAFGRFKSGISSEAGSAVSTVKGIPGRIKGALGNLGGLLVSEGVAIIAGLERGILSRFTALLNKVKGFAHRIKSLKGPIDKDRVLLVDEGRAIIEGLGHGMDREFRALLADVSGMAPTISATFAGSSPAGAAAATPSLGDFHVYIGDKEITDMIDLRIERRDRSGAGAARAGVLR